MNEERNVRIYYRKKGRVYESPPYINSENTKTACESIKAGRSTIGEVEDAWIGPVDGGSDCRDR